MRSYLSCCLVLLGIEALRTSSPVEAFCPPPRTSPSSQAQRSENSLCLLLASKLPRGISPFEKSLARGLDVQGSFRKLAGPAIDRAVRDGRTRVEVDFPVLLGGGQSKSQFDDFDNLSELNANRDWCVQLVPTLASTIGTKRSALWLVLPDDKECELAKNEWGGSQLVRKAAKFTSIRAATLQVAGESTYSKAWGSTMASTMSKLAGGDGILADSSTLDNLSDDVNSKQLFYLVCQPGNGGPVEDWINVERLSKANPDAVTCIVNGALDKVRDGYYPSLFFPALAATIPFYKQFEAAFVLKPISDKGVYGWLYRVYPEPWQVILQTARQQEKNGQVTLAVEESVALQSEKRPSYADAVKALVAAASVVK